MVWFSWGIASYFAVSARLGSGDSNHIQKEAKSKRTNCLEIQYRSDCRTVSHIDVPDILGAFFVMLFRFS